MLTVFALPIPMPPMESMPKMGALLVPMEVPPALDLSMSLLAAVLLASTVVAPSVKRALLIPGLLLEPLTYLLAFALLTSTEQGMVVLALLAPTVVSSLSKHQDRELPLPHMIVHAQPTPTVTPVFMRAQNAQHHTMHHNNRMLVLHVNVLQPRLLPTSATLA